MKHASLVERRRRAVRLLTPHFFRRFFDNDLISPQGGQSDSATILLAAVAVPGLLLSALLLFRYMSPGLNPGDRLLLSLDDRYLGLSFTMIVMGLITLFEWDVLVLDDRDLAVLGALPLTHGTLVRAKLMALGRFVGVFVVAANLLPALLFPPIMLGGLPLGWVRVFWLIAAQLGVAAAASAFAFLSLVAVRNVLALTLGPGLFRRLSVAVQFVGVVALVVALLLVPGHRKVAASLQAPTLDRAWLAPPLWFIGLHETLTANTVLGVPGIEQPRASDRWWNAAPSRERYRALAPRFRELAGVALGMLAAAGALAVGLYALDARRLTRRTSAPGRTMPRWLGRSAAWLARRLIVRAPVAQAAFFFTLQTLSRSLAHRLYLGAYTALAVAVLVVIIPASSVPLAAAAAAGEPIWSVVAAPMVLVLAAVAGFRSVAAVPVALRANWVVRVCWPDDRRRYLSGVRRVVGIAMVLPLLLVAVPGQAWIVGLPTAGLLFILNALLSVMVLEWALMPLDKLPFTCGYAPKGRLKYVWPFYLAVFLCCTVLYAMIVVLALGLAGGYQVLAVTLSVLVLGTLGYRWWRERRHVDVLFDDPADPAAMELGLNAR